MPLDGDILFESVFFGRPTGSQLIRGRYWWAKRNGIGEGLDSIDPYYIFLIDDGCSKSQLKLRIELSIQDWSYRSEFVSMKCSEGYGCTSSLVFKNYTVIVDWLFTFIWLDSLS